jgi:hypothetical protein
MIDSVVLPSGFEDLAEWEEWNLETMEERSYKRSVSSMDGSDFKSLSYCSYV